MTAEKKMPEPDEYGCIKVKSASGYANINACDYDPAIHTLYEEPKAAPKHETRVVEAEGKAAGKAKT